MLLHASSVAIGHEAILLAGPPGAGKSDLALRLIDGGAQLISDDQTELQAASGILTASPPGAIAGLMEVRHVGLVTLPYVSAVPVALYVELVLPGEPLERLPEETTFFLLDCCVRRLRLAALTASAPAKIRAALFYPLVVDR